MGGAGEELEGAERAGRHRARRTSGLLPSGGRERAERARALVDVAVAARQPRPDKLPGTHAAPSEQRIVTTTVQECTLHDARPRRPPGCRLPVMRWRSVSNKGRGRCPTGSRSYGHMASRAELECQSPVCRQFRRGVRTVWPAIIEARLRARVRRGCCKPD